MEDSQLRRYGTRALDLQCRVIKFIGGFHMVCCLNAPSGTERCKCLVLVSLLPETRFLHLWQVYIGLEMGVRVCECRTRELTRPPTGTLSP